MGKCGKTAANKTESSTFLCIRCASLKQNSKVQKNGSVRSLPQGTHTISYKILLEKSAMSMAIYYQMYYHKVKGSRALTTLEFATSQDDLQYVD